jgi:hypothetical protein
VRVGADLSKPRLSSTAHQILAYLFEHPTSQDTLEGIMEWWMLEQQIKRWIAMVEAALDEIVVEGLVLSRTAEDGRIHYRINQQRLDEISELLGQNGQMETTTLSKDDGEPEQEHEI